MPAALDAFPAALRPRTDALQDNALREAFKAGREVGYSDGFVDGKRVGYDAGFKRGQRDTVSRLMRGLPDDAQIAAIKQAVAERFGIPLHEMSSTRRARSISRPRQIAMYLCRELTGRSLPEIGRAFGGRDHTTVMWAVERVGELAGADPQLAAEIQQLRAQAQQRAA